MLLKDARVAGLSAAALAWIAIPVVFGLEHSTAVGLPALALIIASVLLWLDRDALWPLLRLTPRAVLLGCAIGAATAALTYPAFCATVRLYPPLAEQVERAYAPLSEIKPMHYLPLLLLVVFAEEVLWRGSWLVLPGMGRAARFGLAWGTYVIAQAGQGSWLVVLIAAACGAVWLTVRLLSGGLWAPFFTHAVWSATLLLFMPVRAPSCSASAAAAGSYSIQSIRSDSPSRPRQPSTDRSMPPNRSDSTHFVGSVLFEVSNNQHQLHDVTGK